MSTRHTPRVVPATCDCLRQSSVVPTHRVSARDTRRTTSIR